jgi:NO-binding membrane sensor protein with MHYT domain
MRFAVEFTYDSGLVAVSIAIAILGSFTGLVVTTGIRHVQGPEVILRVILGGLAVGGGVWSMHFISMLAVILPVPLSYDLAETALSAVLAVIFTAIAFAIVGRDAFGKYTLPVSALFLGAGIAVMHYLGMYAVRGNCIITYSWLGVFISVAIAVEASAVALWFAFRERGVIDTLLGAVALGLAIASMHYSGMEATRFLPAENAAETFQGALSKTHLAIAISFTIYSVCGMCIFVFAFRTFARRTMSPARTRLN